MHEPEQLPLARLQAWFLTAMTAPGGARRGIELAQQHHGLSQGEVLKSAAGRQARLHIYADGYVQRLLECLQADFPVLRKTMGAELFDFFARAYVWRHPSRSPTLYDLGGGFADFLAASQPAGGGEQLRFPVELARLERARSEAGRAPGLEQRAPPPMLDLAWLTGGETRLRLAPCTRLLALSFPLQAFWREAQAHLMLAFGSLGAALLVGIPAGIAIFQAPRWRGPVLGVLNMVLVKSSRESLLSQPSGISYAIPVQHLRALIERK